MQNYVDPDQTRRWRGMDFFYLPLTAVKDIIIFLFIFFFFFCTPFISERRFFDNTVTLMADVHITGITVTFNDVITFSNVNLNDGIRDVHFNQCISNT